MEHKIGVALLTLLVVCSCGKKQEAEHVQPVKVVTMMVGTSSSEEGQTYSGTIEEESGQSLSFAGMGTVQRILVSEGQFVKKGQLIGILDNTSVRNAYDAAVASKAQAIDAQNRMKMLHDNGSLPDIKWVEVQTQVRQAKAQEQIARKSLYDTRLYAPFSGYVTKKYVDPGANVSPGVPVVNLVKIEQVKVKISVPEEEIALFHTGMTVRVRVAALGNRLFTARVTEKNVSADALSRSYEVKAVMANSGHELLPGMIAEVEADVPSVGQRSVVPEGIAVPAGIVQLDADNHTFVWRVVGGKAKKTYITTGDNIGEKIAVTDGLRQGDKIIVNGQQKVSSGMAVTE